LAAALEPEVGHAIDIPVSFKHYCEPQTFLVR
jgi:hypothetical protein